MKAHLLLSLLATAAFAEVNPAISAAMDEFIAAKEISGAVTLVANEEKTLHLGANGFADLENKASMEADALFWITAGTGVGLLAAGTVTGVLALQREEDVQSFVIGPDGSAAQRQALSDQADALALSTDVLWISGAVAVTSAALLFLLRDAEQAPAVKAGVATDGRSARLELTGSF